MATKRSSTRAVPLSEAAWHFAPAGLRRQLDDPQPGWDRLAQMEKHNEEKYAHLDDAAKARIAGFAEFGKIATVLAAKGKAQYALDHALLEKLRAGTLIAAGHPTHKDDPDQLEPVPRYLFQHQYAKWSKSVFEGRGRRYELVEVSRPPAKPMITAIPAPIGDSLPPEAPYPSKRPVGRPNVKSKITEITLEILDNPTSPPWKFMTELHSEIRKIGKIKYPTQFDDNNPKAQVMRYGINNALDIRPHKRPKP